MGVVVISLPNLATDVALIATTIANIEAAAPDNLRTFLNPRFMLKSSADCSTFYFDDLTDYDEVVSIDPADVAINVTFFYKDQCGEYICLCPSQPMANNGRLEFQNEMGDGEYCAVVDVVYADPITPTNIYSEQIEYCVTQKCCNNNMITLRDKIECKMAGIGCKINDFKKIGRNTTKLDNNYLKLSNMLWMIDNSNRSCRLYEVLSCLFKKI